MCIPVFWYCDGKVDCPLESDEEGCSCEQLGMIECFVTANDTTCMPVSWACGGHPHCPSPELDLCKVVSKADNCDENQFWCHLEEIPGRQCIPLSKTCDNVTDCLGGEDEAYCSGLILLYLF